MTEKILILGGGGMLGHKLCQALTEKFEVYATVRSTSPYLAMTLSLPTERIFSDFSAESDAAILELFTAVKPAVVINCIGIVKQLEEASKPLPSIKINSLLPHRLYKFCQLANARLIHISTDCVFSGKHGNYVESDLADAYDLYGRSKFLGEVINDNALTIRTSIIGRQLSGHHSLFDWFISNQNKTVSGYSKAFFSGVTTLELSKLISEIITNFPALQGLYQVAGEKIDKYSLLQLTSKTFDLSIQLDKNDTFEIDRSLCDDRFRAITKITKKDWPLMLEEMRNFDQIHSVIETNLK